MLASAGGDGGQVTGSAPGDLAVARRHGPAAAARTLLALPPGRRQRRQHQQPDERERDRPPLPELPERGQEPARLARLSWCLASGTWPSGPSSPASPPSPTPRLTQPGKEPESAQAYRTNRQPPRRMGIVGVAAATPTIPMHRTGSRFVRLAVARARSGSRLTTGHARDHAPIMSIRARRLPVDRTPAGSLR